MGPIEQQEVAELAGLRERKKQQTRNALIRTAFELFVSQGYEQTTVEGIARAVDVSERTFFRYFAVKEDVVFAVQEMIQEQFVARLRARPPEEPPLAAMRAALDEGWQSIGEAITEVIPLELHLRMWQLIETTPALTAAQLWHSLEAEDRLAAAVAERAGVDPYTDPRPRVLVAAFSGVLRTAMRTWGHRGDVTVAGAQQQVCEFLDQLPAVLDDQWRPRTPAAQPN